MILIYFKNVFPYDYTKYILYFIELNFIIPKLLILFKSTCNRIFLNCSEWTYKIIRLFLKWLNEYLNMNIFVANFDHKYFRIWIHLYGFIWIYSNILYALKGSLVIFYSHYSNSFWKEQTGRFVFFLTSCKPQN